MAEPGRFEPRRYDFRHVPSVHVARAFRLHWFVVVRTTASSRATARRSRQPAPRRAVSARSMSAPALRCRRKFLRFFPQGFSDETYIDWERAYKSDAHERWVAALNPDDFGVLLRDEQYAEIARRAVSIESRTNLLFSFEKMALRDAVRPPHGARDFAQACTNFCTARGMRSGSLSGGATCSRTFRVGRRASSHGH